jgi:hypothetical protein
MTHLWEIHHPYYGAEGHAEQVDTFAELRASVDPSDEDMNHVYRWDWQVADEHDDDKRDRLYVFLAMPRKSGFWSVSCPISRDQEAEVLEWLRGPRILGALRTLWEPLLTQDPEDVVNLRSELAAVREGVRALFTGDYMPTPAAVERALHPEVSS